MSLFVFLFVFVPITALIVYMIGGHRLNVFSIISFVVITMVGFNVIGAMENNICESITLDSNASATTLFGGFFSCPVRIVQNSFIDIKKSPEPSDSPRQLPGYNYNPETYTYEKIQNTTIPDIKSDAPQRNYTLDDNLGLKDLEKI